MPIWQKMIRQSFVAAVFAALAVGSAQEATLHLNARTIYDRAVSNNVVLSHDGSAIELQSGEVFQDDGPASGFSYKPNSEVLSPGIAIRKQLLIPDPQASQAFLMVGGSGNLGIEVNGLPQELKAPRKIFYGQWQEYDIDPAALKPGVNDFVLRGTGTVNIARLDDSYVELPHRSARSADDGKSWSVDKFGSAGDIAGEYYVRVYLKRSLVIME